MIVKYCVINKCVTLFLSQSTDTVVNFMIKLPVDLSGVPPYIIKVRNVLLPRASRMKKIMLCEICGQLLRSLLNKKLYA